MGEGLKVPRFLFSLLNHVSKSLLSSTPSSPHLRFPNIRLKYMHPRCAAEGLGFLLNRLSSGLAPARAIGSAFPSC